MWQYLLQTRNKMIELPLTTSGPLRGKGDSWKTPSAMMNWQLFNLTQLLIGNTSLPTINYKSTLLSPRLRVVKIGNYKYEYLDGIITM